MDYLKFALRGTAILFVIAALLILLACQPQVAQAASGSDCRMLADGIEYQLVNSLKLSDAVSESPSLYVEGQLDDSPFMTTNAQVVIYESTKLLLSGSSEGSGFVADDLIRLSVQPSGERLEWDFRSQDFTRIIPASSPLEITNAFVAGTNQLQINGYDLLGPVYSASELWLLILEPCHVVTASEPVTPTLTVADIVEKYEELQPNPQTAVDAQTEAVLESAIESEAEPVVEAAEMTEPDTEIELGQAVENTDGVENIETVQSERPVAAVESDSAISTQNVVTEQQRKPILRGFTIGLFLALLLVGASIWRGRETLMDLYDEALPYLAQLQRKAKQRIDDARTWLASLQE